MRRDQARLSLAVVVLSAGWSVAGCGDDKQYGAAGANERSFEEAVTALKLSQPADYDAGLRRLQDAYGIQRLGDVGLGQIPPVKPQLTESSVVDKLAAPAAATEVYSTTYNVRRTEFQTMQLTAGERLDWYTKEVTANADPVMALVQYEQTNSNCTINASAMPKFAIKAYNDDYSGRHSRIQYTVPATGCYALLIYAYSPSSAGTVHLIKDGCAAPPPPRCSGGICVQDPAQCWQTTGYGGVNVLATGTAVRGTTTMDIMTTLNSTGGADPWIFALNLSNMTGASNDDYQGVNSLIDRTDFQFVGTYPNTVVLTGYNSVGTATFKGYQR